MLSNCNISNEISKDFPEDFLISIYNEIEQKNIQINKKDNVDNFDNFDKDKNKNKQNSRCVIL